jgi:flagellar basal-body rod modification protein FlgD
MSSVSAITNTAVTGTASSDSVSSGKTNTLTQNDFLQLLVTQMENQDPTNPQSDTDMAAQMAQFTSLTQATAMSSSLAMMQADSLVGSTVGLQVDSSTTTSGVVNGVILKDGVPNIEVNGADYTLSQVLSVTPAATTASGTAANQGSTVQ